MINIMILNSSEKEVPRRFEIQSLPNWLFNVTYLNS